MDPTATLFWLGLMLWWWWVAHGQSDLDCFARIGAVSTVAQQGVSPRTVLGVELRCETTCKGDWAPRLRWKHKGDSGSQAIKTCRVSALNLASSRRAAYPFRLVCLVMVTMWTTKAHGVPPNGRHYECEMYFNRHDAPTYNQHVPTLRHVCYANATNEVTPTVRDADLWIDDTDVLEEDEERDVTKPPWWSLFTLKGRAREIQPKDQPERPERHWEHKNSTATTHKSCWGVVVLAMTALILYNVTLVNGAWMSRNTMLPLLLLVAASVGTAAPRTDCAQHPTNVVIDVNGGCRGFAFECYDCSDYRPERLVWRYKSVTGINRYSRYLYIFGDDNDRWLDNPVLDKYTVARAKNNLLPSRLSAGAMPSPQAFLYGGAYSCMNVGQGWDRAAQLIAVRDPVCSTSAASAVWSGDPSLLNDHPFIRDHPFVHLRCSVDFNGYWPPRLRWRQLGAAFQTCRVSPQKLRVAATRSNETTAFRLLCETMISRWPARPYQCEVYFNRRDMPPGDEYDTKYDETVPTYSRVCNVLHVDDQEGKLKNAPVTSFDDPMTATAAPDGGAEAFAAMQNVNVNYRVINLEAENGFYDEQAYDDYRFQLAPGQYEKENCRPVSPAMEPLLVVRNPKIGIGEPAFNTTRRRRHWWNRNL